MSRSWEATKAGGLDERRTLTAAVNLFGFGITFGLIWILGVGVALVRWAPSEPAAAGAT